MRLIDSFAHERKKKEREGVGVGGERGKTEESKKKQDESSKKVVKRMCKSIPPGGYRDHDGVSFTSL